MPAWTVLFYGSGNPGPVVLTKTEYQIGADVTCAIRWDNPQIPALLCTLSQNEGLWQIVPHLPLLLNNTPCPAAKILKGGDVITYVGSPEFRMVMHDPAVAGAVTEAKKPIGHRTMMGAIAQAEASQKRRLKVAILATAGIMVSLLAIVVFFVIQDHQAAQEQIKNLQDQHDANQTQLAELQERLNEQRQHLQEERNRIQSEIAAHNDILNEMAVNSSSVNDQDARAKREAQAALALLSRKLSLAEAALARLENREDQAGNNWSAVASDIAPSLFLCIAADPETKETAIGTAFVATDTGVLFTNAHVAMSLRDLAIARVIQNKTGLIYLIDDIKIHPGFRGAASPDIALIKLKLDDEHPAPPPVTFATSQETIEMQQGDELATLGFPGELRDNYLGSVEKRRFLGVQATFKTGWIGRLTDYDGRNTDPSKAVWIQHSASLSGGTSGSPMVNKHGHVIAMSNSSLAETTVTDNANQSNQPTQISAAQIAFAIRIDEALQFMQQFPWASIK